MKKRLFIFIGIIFLLGGCKKQLTAKNTAKTSDSTTNTVTQEELHPIFFQYLKDRYQKALDYAKDKKNVQTPLAALIMAYNELEHTYPKKVKEIDNIYSDFQQFLNWQPNDWKTLFNNWSNEVNQHYEQIKYPNFTKQHPFFQKLQQTTVNDRKVNWNVFGVTDSNDYAFLVLDAYQDIQNKHLYLFTIQHGIPVVLYTHATIDNLTNNNFKPTENEALTKYFTNYVKHPTNATLTNENETNKNDLDLSEIIDQFLKEYGNRHGQKYRKISPATQGNYYELAAPDQLFEYSNINNQTATFTWDATNKASRDTYFIEACYVNESGTEVIVFCKKDGQPIILHTVGQPIIQKNDSKNIETATINFEKMTDSLLQSVFK